MRTDQEIDKEMFLRRSDEERRAIQDLEPELARLRARAASLDGSTAARVVKAIQVVMAGRAKLTGEQRRGIIRSVVRRIEVAATRTGAVLRRDAQGRVLPGGVSRWRVAKVSITVALDAKGGDDAPREPGGGELLAGQLGTTFSCWARPAPARR